MACNSLLQKLRSKVGDGDWESGDGELETVALTVPEGASPARTTYCHWVTAALPLEMENRVKLHAKPSQQMRRDGADERRWRWVVVDAECRRWREEMMPVTTLLACCLCLFQSGISQLGIWVLTFLFIYIYILI